MLDMVRSRTQGAYQGWTMVVVSFLCAALAFGASTATMPLIYSEVMREFGWTHTETTLIYTYKNVASAVMALFVVGPLIVRFGLRPVMIGSIVTTGIGMLSFLWVHVLWIYYLSGFILGLGVATVLIGAEMLVSRWFLRRQGLAIGIALTGGSAGGIVFSILAERLIGLVGWRPAFALMSIGLWVVALPLYIWKAKEQPSRADILPEAPAGHPPEIEQRLHPARLRVSEETGRLLRLPQFWTILCCLVVLGAIDSGLFQHTALFLQREGGFSADVAAYSLSAIFALTILGKVVAGRLFDRTSMKGMGAWHLLGAVALMAALSVQGAFTLVLFVILRGVSHGGMVTEPPVIAKHCYGPHLLNLTLPIYAGAWSVGAAIGPVTLSMVYEHYGSYQWAFVASIILTLVAAVLIYRIQPLYRQSLAAGSTQDEAPAIPAAQPDAMAAGHN